MDAPNAPNPANPNAQDQFVDVVQGPTNQAQGPTVQNQAQGPAVQNPVQGPTVQNQAQVPAGQIPVQSPAQASKIYQFSHHHNQPQYNCPLLVM